MTKTSASSDILRKTRALLNKAEGTDNEHERDAFLAKAQEMMERYAITTAQMELEKGSEQREPIEQFVAWPARTVGKQAKGSLAISIASSNRCIIKARRDIDENGKWILGLVFQGMPEDVEFCVMLYTSLCLQAEQAYNPKNRPEWTNPRTYKASFYEGFCARVRDRVAEQARERKQTHASGTDMVLVGVQKRIEEKFGKSRYGSRRVSDSCATGRNDGRQAGDRADMSGGQTKQMANRKQVTS